jgi:succinate-acetate transporter protein
MSTQTLVRPGERRWTEAGPVDGAIDRTEVEHLESRREATIGDMVPMGLFGFSIGTLAIAWVLAGWATLPSSYIAAVPALLVFAGVGQFVAGLYSLARTNTWEGTLMTVYGANYGLIAVFLWMRHMGVIPFTHHNMLLPAVDMFCVAYISLALAMGAMALSRTYVALTVFAAIGYCLTGIQFLGAHREVGILGGYFLLVAAFFAFYAATANLVNSSWRREMLPLYSLKHKA